MKVEKYEANVPSWIDFGSADVEKAVAFYSELLGWDAEDQGEQFGHYHIARRGGEMVAGLSPNMSPGPSHWSTYVNVDNADETAAKASGAGGSVLVEPMDVPGAGKMAFLADPSGAAIGLWQPNQHHGAGLVNEPGTWTWSNLLTRDTAGANAFYSKVFSWEVTEQTDVEPSGFVYSVSGRPVASATLMPDVVPASVPPYWDVSFSVDDVDQSLETARRLGGSVAMGPEEIGPGRIAAVLDPEGAIFGLITVRGA